MSVGGVGRSIAGVTAAFAGAAGLTSVVRTAFTEMAEANKVAAQTRAVLESTGRIAGVTAGHVDELANSLLRKTGIDDEAIKSSENLLLTFTNIRNVAGQNNDIFDQATVAALNLSTALGTDLRGATIQIGKALQDPIRGVTALRRAGVQLTKDQEAQIRTLVKTGRVMEAQKIILGELATQVGGAAEAAGDAQPWNRLRETIRNVQADLARQLLPTIENVVGRLQTWLDDTGNVARIQATFDTIRRTIGRVADGVRTVNDMLGGWKTTLQVLTGLWLGFKIAGITSATAVLTANTYAAAGTAAAWKAALISTGFGALAVAAGLAATYVITHWEKVKTWFARLWIGLKAGAIEAARRIVDAWSKLPDFLGGGAAERARESLERSLAGLREDWEQAGVSSGEAYLSGIKKAMKAQERTGLGAGPGMTPPGWLPGGAKPPGTGGGGAGGPRGVTAGQRNQWFDANLARQLDRLQDLGLRKQLARLRQLAAEVKARLAVTRDATRRLTLEDTLLGILRQQRAVQADIVDNIRAANDALKDRADAIKSAVLDRLQARQTDILNKRALADAKEQLRIARQIGGPQGIKGAMRGLQDVQFDIMRARLEAAPATLTPTGRFQLGNVVTINVHGVTDPAAVARQVTEILKKRSRRTTTQIRPTAAGQTA